MRLARVHVGYQRATQRKEWIVKGAAVGGCLKLYGRMVKHGRVGDVPIFVLLNVCVAGWACSTVVRVTTNCIHVSQLQQRCNGCEPKRRAL